MRAWPAAPRRGWSVGLGALVGAALVASCGVTPAPTGPAPVSAPAASSAPVASVAPASSSASALAPMASAPVPVASAPACEPACVGPLVCSQGACVRAVEVAPDAPCVRLQNGRVRCWTESEEGEPSKGESAEVDGIESAQRFLSASCVQSPEGGAVCFDQRLRSVSRDESLPWATSGFLPVEAKDVVQVSGYSDYACAVKPDGRVLCWGSNREGGIGVDSKGIDDVREPTLVPGLTSVKSVASGLLHSCALRRDGRVVCWGSDECGNLGAPQVRLRDHARPGAPLSIKGKVKEVRVASMGGKGCALTEDGRVQCWGRWCIGIRQAYSQPTPPREVAGVTDAISVSARVGGGVAVKRDGSVVVWVDDPSGHAASVHPVVW